MRCVGEWVIGWIEVFDLNFSICRRNCQRGQGPGALGLLTNAIELVKGCTVQMGPDKAGLDCHGRKGLDALGYWCGGVVKVWFVTRRTIRLPCSVWNPHALVHVQTHTLPFPIQMFTTSVTLSLNKDDAFALGFLGCCVGWVGGRLKVVV